MIRNITFLIVLIQFSGGSSWAADGVNFLIAIHQKKPDSQEKVLLYSDSATVIKGLSASAFLTGLSLDMEVTALDTAAVEFNVHVITLGSSGNAIAKRFKTEYGLPALIDDIEVKPGSIY